MKHSWHQDRDRFEFETRDLKGMLVADDDQYPNNRHKIIDLIHKQTGSRVTPEGSRMEKAGAFTVFRSYAKRSWLTELRAIKPEVIREEQGVCLIWPPTIKHQVLIKAAFIIREPNIIDLDLSLEGYAFYPDYELLISNYVAERMQGGLYVRKDEFSEARDHEKIDVTDNAAFHGMYPFFPRDEQAAHIMTDGRGQKGRWYWRVACGRQYAYPMGFASDGQVDVLFMGRPEDVSAVGVTYSADENHYDGVAGHHALYLSLFGRDLYPGDGWRTQVRLVVCQHDLPEDGPLSAFNQFLSDVTGYDRSFEVAP